MGESGVRCDCHKEVGIKGIPVSETSTKIVDLNGAFRYKVDAKGRVCLPAKFRRALSNDLVIIKSPDNECLFVFEPDAFNAWVDQLFIDRFGAYSASNKNHVRLRSALKARAFDCQVDAAGRIVLPADVRHDVHVERDVVVVGNTGYFEIWDASRYDDMTKEIDLSVLFS